MKAVVIVLLVIVLAFVFSYTCSAQQVLFPATVAPAAPPPAVTLTFDAAYNDSTAIFVLDSIKQTVTITSEDYRVSYCYVLSSQGYNPTYVNLGGSAMTLIDSQALSVGESGRMSWLYRMIAPSSGSQSWVVGKPSADVWSAAILVTFYGAHQTTPNDAISKATATDNPISTNISSETGDIVVDFVWQNADIGDNTAVGSGQTEQPSPHMVIYDRVISSSREAGAATTTMGWTNTGTYYLCQMAFNINKYAP